MKNFSFESFVDTQSKAMNLYSKVDESENGSYEELIDHLKTIGIKGYNIECQN